MALFGKLIKHLKKILTGKPVRRRKGKRSRRRAVRRRTFKKFPRKSKFLRKNEWKKKTRPQPAKVNRRRPKRKTGPRPLPSGGMKKPRVKQPPSKSAGKPTAVASADQGVLVADITHYFSKIMVCVLKMRRSLAAGDTIRIKGRKTDFVQKVESLQIESIDVKTARKGQLVGLKVKEACKEGDLVFKVKG